MRDNASKRPIVKFDVNELQFFAEYDEGNIRLAIEKKYSEHTSSKLMDGLARIIHRARAKQKEVSHA